MFKTGSVGLVETKLFFLRHTYQRYDLTNALSDTLNFFFFFLKFYLKQYSIPIRQQRQVQNIICIYVAIRIIKFTVEIKEHSMIIIVSECHFHL